MTFIKCLIRYSKTIARRTDPISYLTLKGSYLLCRQTDLPIHQEYLWFQFSFPRTFLPHETAAELVKVAVPFSKSLSCGG